MHKTSATKISATYPVAPGRIILIQNSVASVPLCRPRPISTFGFSFGARSCSVWNKKRLRVEQEAAPCRARNEALEFGFLEKLFSRSRDAEQIPMPGRAVFNGTAIARRFFSKNHLKGCVARQDADSADGNKDDRIEATLLIPRQQAKPHQTVKSRRETALIRLCNTYKQCSSSPIDRMPRRGQITCLGMAKLFASAWLNRLPRLGPEPE